LYSVRNQARPENLYTQLHKFYGDFVSFHTEFLDFWEYWASFFESDNFTFRNLILDIKTTIDNQVNPTSPDNIDNFNASVKNLEDNTFIGGVKGFGDSGERFVSSLQNVDPRQHIYVNTKASNFFGISIPAQQIDIDFSWYGAYRDEVFSVLRAFIYLGYFILVYRMLPSIIGGGSAIFAPQHDANITEFENITINEDGVVTHHSTTSRQGNVTITQNHDYSRGTKL